MKQAEVDGIQAALRRRIACKEEGVDVSDVSPSVDYQGRD